MMCLNVDGEISRRVLEDSDRPRLELVASVACSVVVCMCERYLSWSCLTKLNMGKTQNLH